MTATTKVKPLPRRRVLWLVLVGVSVPLVAILALQFVSLTKLRHASAGEQRLARQRYLEKLADKIAYAYETRAGEILNLSPPEFADNSRVAAHFAKAESKSARLFFVVRYRKDYDQTLFFNSTAHSMELRPGSDEERRVSSVTAPWRVLSLNGATVQPNKVRVTQLDPETRVMIVPATDATSRVIGVSGIFVDHDYFKNSYLARVIGSFKTEFAGIVPPAEIVVTVRDGYQQLVYSSSAVKQPEDEVSVPMKFVYTDWRLGVQSAGWTPEQWARTNFFLGLSLTVLMALVLIAALAWALRTSAREMRLSQMKSDFVSNVSHELRTPLSSIRVFAEFFRLGWIEDRQKVRECGEYIEAESRRLTQLINNILDFSKIESGQKEYKFVETDVTELVSDALKTFEMPLKQRGISVKLESPSDGLPRISIDRDAIAQAFMNLLDNAAKYSGVGREILIRLFEREGLINIAVSDQGIGILPEDRKLIFEKFYRVSTGLVYNIKGSGLGLAIVDHIVKSHSGKITVDSAAGRGSTFVIQLPVNTNHPTDDGPAHGASLARNEVSTVTR